MLPQNTRESALRREEFHQTLQHWLDESFDNFVGDPDEITNIVDEPSFAARVSSLREALLAHHMACARTHAKIRRAVAYEGRIETEKRCREELSGQP